MAQGRVIIWGGVYAEVRTPFKVILSCSLLGSMLELFLSSWYKKRKEESKRGEWKEEATNFLRMW